MEGECSFCIGRPTADTILDLGRMQRRKLPHGQRLQVVIPPRTFSRISCWNRPPLLSYPTRLRPYRTPTRPIGSLRARRAIWSLRVRQDCCLEEMAGEVYGQWADRNRNAGTNDYLGRVRELRRGTSQVFGLNLLPCLHGHLDRDKVKRQRSRLSVRRDLSALRDPLVRSVLDLDRLGRGNRGKPLRQGYHPPAKLSVPSSGSLILLGHTLVQSETSPARLELSRSGRVDRSSHDEAVRIWTLITWI